MTIRIGFYICHCGTNIAQRVRVKEVADAVGRRRHVVVSRDYKFMCSDPGQAMIEKDIVQYQLNRVVVASCSPRLHGKTFMAACARAGLNPYFFQMASVREQVSWVTADEDLATAKAEELAGAAVERVVFHHPLTVRHTQVHPDVLVVGGGIAGMQAALDIADGGHQVYLVEKSTTIGGHMLQFDKTFPTLDCAACIGTPKMVSVAQHPKITLFSLSRVVEISGFVGNYRVKIRRAPRYVKEGVCTGCGECAKVCPVEIPNPWDQGLATRKAIGRAFPQAIPITFNIEKKDRAPCSGACPAGVNVQGYVQLIGQGKYEQAVALIMERVPLPGVLGRICPHPCQDQCRRARVDAPLAIAQLKRFAADQVAGTALPPPDISEQSQRVAVIGSGPAGLSAAYYLRLKGYQIVIFEALDKLGGMLRVGIPDYRLPPDILDQEIDRILALGIEVRTGKRLGRDFALDDLRKEGFDAVFCSLGAHRAVTVPIPGADGCDGVMDAVTFLRRVNLGEPVPKGSRVAVIGGGNVAVDAARAALRLGSKQVTIVYRRSAEEMPAYEEEVQGAVAEGVEIRYLSAPLKVVGGNGGVSELICGRNKLGPPDATGRRRPVPVPGSDFRLACDLILLGIGQTPDLTWAEDLPELGVSAKNTLEVDPATGRTAVADLFAAGDMVSGPATAIEAVGAAHRAVAAMDAFLQGRETAVPEKGAEEVPAPVPDWMPIPEDISPQPAAVPPHLPPKERRRKFDEVCLGLSESAAREEAQRCLNCGVCSECKACVAVCEARAIDHGMRPEEVEIQVGSLILATGYDTLDPAPMRPFGYGRFENVLTSLEFERLSNATGPTSGRILMRRKGGGFGEAPRSVALLHCIGSRDVNYHEYCSRVCCMYALKYAHLIKEKVGHRTPVYQFYIDMRCYGEGYEEFYRRCQQEGTIFVRGKAAEITDQPETPSEKGYLVVVAEDTLLGRRLRIPVDMVVLCTAIEARKDAGDVGRLFGVNLGSDGFFLEEHPKLAPLNTAVEGVFIAGCCQKPMDIPDTVASASGAAVKALSLATRGEVEMSPTISAIDPDICAGCRTCIDLCPYGAISFNALKGVSEINGALCKGCGTCSAVCPSGAARSRHFTPKQVMAELDGLFNTLHQSGALR